MPPPLAFLVGRNVIRPTVQCRAPILTFGLQPSRSASILNQLSNTPGAYSKRHRLGRGASSGKGKTSGRGTKGQHAHGKVPAGFNGGQTKDEIVHGIRGFTNVLKKDMAIVNLYKVQEWIDQGRLDATQPITPKELLLSRCVHRFRDGIKLLADGAEQLKQPITIYVCQASSTAITRVETMGGIVITRYYTPQAINHILGGDSHPYLSRPDGFLKKLPDPTSRKDIEYYMDKRNRGYMSHLAKDGNGPSLFWKKPSEYGDGTREISSKKKEQGENQLW